MTLWGLWLLLRSSVKVSLWYLVPVAFVVFSLEQWENILWGWQIAIYSMVCASVWSLYLLSRPGLRKLAIANLFAIIASFSFANGLMIWPAGFIYLILAYAGRNRLLIWCGAAAIVLFVYLRNYVTQVTRPAPTGLVRPTSISEFFESPISHLTQDPLSLPAMVLGNAGALLSPQNYALAVTIGLAIVVIFFISIYLLIRTRSAWTTMPLSLVALALLSFLSSLTIIVGRMGYWDKAFVLSSRYTTITLLGIAATYLLTVSLANGPRLANWNYQRVGAFLCGVTCLIIVLGLPSGFQLGLVKGQEQSEERLWKREMVQHFEMHSDEELSMVYPKALRERLLYWQSRKLEPFDE
jgi:hypothetical protein